MQQILPGCAFRDALPSSDLGEAHTWGRKNGLLTRSVSIVRSRHSQIPTSATTTPGTDADSSSTHSRRRRRFTPASSGTFGPARLTRFQVKLGHLEGPLQLCARCSPNGSATYWTRDLEYLVASPDE